MSCVGVGVLELSQISGLGFKGMIVSHFMRYAPVQVEVMEEVCWPAKRAAISRPVTSASLVGRPVER